MTTEQSFAVATQHHQAGRLREAELIYRQILAHEPSNAVVIQALGLLAYHVNRLDQAVSLLQHAISLAPDLTAAHSNLGNALQTQGLFDEAIACYQRALTLSPNHAEAHNNLGSALKAKGQLDEAINSYHRALTLRPNDAEVYNNLGLALKSKGQLDEAIASIQRAVALKPDYAEAHNNLGILFQDKGQIDEAMDCYRRAIALRPDYAEAHNNLGNAFRAKHQPDEAIACYQQTLTFRPEYAEAHNNLGNVLKDQGRLDQAIASYRRALAINPDAAVVHSNLIYAIQYHPAYDAKALMLENRSWDQRHAQRYSTSKPHTNDRSPQRRLRIGYVSADFRYHACAYFLDPLLRCHDHDQFEIVCYAQVSTPDSLTEQFRKYADRWRNTVELSDEKMAEQIRQDGIDILVDLKLHTAENRLPVFARKPAPIQVSWLGYPGSSGLSAIDYRFSDPYQDLPGMAEESGEQAIQLPDTYWPYDPLSRDPPVNELPALRHGFVTFGCLCTFAKVSDRVLELWAAVMNLVPNSRLLLLAQPGIARQRALDTLGREGIAADRVEFAERQPRLQYLSLYHRIDVGLDCFPYNGHTTSLDSFWMGVPVVTLIGRTAVGRVGWSHLGNLDLKQLAAQTPEQFVQIASALVADLPKLSQLRTILRQRMQQSPLMDAPRFTRNIEAAYRQMWRKWCDRS